MRSIKLRGWDKKEKKMYYFNLSIYMSLNENAQEDLCPYLVDDLMLFTGLLDKNGKEDYHKDICEYYDDSLTLQIGVIEEIDGCWTLVAIGGDEEGNQNSQLAHTDHINIGNIYENPELLKGE